MGKPVKRILKESYDRLKKVMQKLSGGYSKKHTPALIPIPVKKN
jgi:hypothetical protein